MVITINHIFINGPFEHFSIHMVIWLYLMGQIAVPDLKGELKKAVQDT